MSEDAKQRARSLTLAQDVDFLPAADFRIDRCPLCAAEGDGRLSVFPAPLGNRMRSRIVWWCEGCGSGFVPKARAFLADYYDDAYAREVKDDRARSPHDFFSEQTRAKSPSINKYFRRVEFQKKVLNRHRKAFDAILDFGSGPGYFLKETAARLKYAVEPDRNSRKYLDYIGAITIDLDAVPAGSLDLIIASHALEHMCGEELVDLLARMHTRLKSDGLLYVEVPQGALSAVTLAYKHEPHTIFFTPAGLEAAIRRAGFFVVERRYRALKPGVRRANAMWSPNPADPFHSAISGGMTIVARRDRRPVRSAPPEPPPATVDAPDSSMWRKLLGG